MEKLDIERLAKVASGEISYRRCGYSLLYAFESISLCFRPESKGKIVIVHDHDRSHTFRMLVRICNSICEPCHMDSNDRLRVRDTYYEYIN